MANNTLGTIRGTIEIDYDGAGIVKAVRDTDRAEGSLNKLDDSVSRVLSTFRSFSRVAATAGASSLALNGGLQLVAGTLAVMGPLAAAGIATLPGILMAAHAASAVVKIAMIGVSDALQAATGDAKKFEEAIKELAPPAQDFARAWRASLDVLKPVQKEIQGAFFTGLGPELRRIVPLIASLQAQAIGVAGAMNFIIREVSQFATSSRSIENVRAILSGVNAFLLQIRGSVGPVVAAFINLGAQASGFAGSFGETVGAVLQRFAVFLEGIDLAAMFERAMPIIQALGTFLSNMGTILSSLLTVFNVDGANAAGVLGELTGKLAAFLESAEGQEALRALGQAMAAISGAAGQVFLTLLQELAPIIVALAPGLAQLATQLATVLVPALQILGPLLQGVAGFLSENMSWIGPLAGAVVAGAAAYRTYTAALGAWRAAETAAQALRLKSVATWIASTAAMVANKAAMVAHLAMAGAMKVATLAWAGVQWILNASMFGFPLVWILAAIAAVIAIVILLVKNWDTVVAFLGKAWEWIKEMFQRGLDYVISYWKFVWGLVMSYIQFVINFWRTVFSAIWNWLKAGWKLLVDSILAYIRLWRDGFVAVVDFFSGLVRRVRDYFEQLRTAVIERIRSVIQTMRDLPGRIVGVLANMGRLLYNKGRDLIQGFINGILGMINRVRNAASSVVSAVTDYLPGSPAKEGPLSGRGYALLRARRMMEDLARGINDAQGLPVTAMAGVIRPVAAAASGGLSGASTGRSTTVVNNTSGGSLTVGQLVVRGVFDPTDPAATRQLVGNLHEAIETYKREYR